MLLPTNKLLKQAKKNGKVAIKFDAEGSIREAEKYYMRAYDDFMTLAATCSKQAVAYRKRAIVLRKQYCH